MYMWVAKVRLNGTRKVAKFRFSGDRRDHVRGLQNKDYRVTLAKHTCPRGNRVCTKPQKDQKSKQSG